MRLVPCRTFLCLIALVAVDTAGASRPGAPNSRCTLTASAGANVQQMLDRLPASGAPVVLCLDAGEFRLSRFLAIERDGVILRGTGPATVLRLDEGIQSPLVVVGDPRHQVPSRPITDVTIERIRLRGNGGAGGEFQPDHPYLTNSAVVVRAGRAITLRELDVDGCRSACLLTEHDTRDVVIERNTITGSTWDGISLNRTARARLMDNRIRDNRAAGITAEHLEDSVIEHNVVADNRAHGVYLADSYRNLFDDNRFTGNTNAGVFLTCAVRDRDPDPVRCWTDSMSAANRFERNEFVGNRRAFIVAANATAGCTRVGFVPNVSSRDWFPSGRAIDQRPDVFGDCLDLEQDSPGTARILPRSFFRFFD